MEKAVYQSFLERAKSLHLNNQLEEAEKIYKKLLGAGVRDGNLYFFYGSLLLQTGKFRKAKMMLQDALRIDPGLPQLLNNLGLVFQNLGEHEVRCRSHQYCARPHCG